MAYIGNAKTPLIYATNVRDDIVPDGVATSFPLSQEVPGGYENNVLVVRRKYLLEDLVSSNVIAIDGTLEKLTINDDGAGAVASLIQPPIPNIYPGDNIVISGATNPQNNSSFPVLSVSFDGTICEIFVNGNLATESGATITLVRGHIGPWEILEAEIDYTISGAGPDYNKIITFSEVPQIADTIYVLHRGDATYNFAPSSASVGPEQLQQNLRNFVCNRYTGDGIEDTFALTQFAVNSKTLQVTVDGVHKDGDDPDQSFIGDWTLALDGLSITFAVPPINLSKIKILHLGFSTVSRRAALSPGQVGAIAPNSITSTQLAPNSVTSSELDNDSVTTSKIVADAVDGSKILLNNEENLRGKKLDTTPVGLLRINASDQTVIKSQGDTLIEFGSTVKLRLDTANNALVSETDNDVSLGTALKKYSALFVQGTARLGATEVDSLDCNGNASVDGNIILTTPGATVDGIDLTALQAAFVALQAQVTALVPPGTMKMWMVDSAAPAGYLLCQGQSVATATYPDLFAALGYTFGGAGPSFSLPDLRQRFPIGKAAAGTGSGWALIGGTGGNIDHTHTGGAHTHDITHTHGIPGHYHALGSGADLAIGASGTHTTTIDISHGHTASSIASGTGVSVNSNTAGISSSGTGSSNANVSVSGSGTGISIAAVGNHSHGVTTRSGAGSNPYKPDANQGSLTPGRDFNTDSAGGHTHTVTDPGHAHGISQSGHSHTVSITDPGHGHGIADPTHSHTITVNSLGTTNRQDTGGLHSHSTGNFSGRVGNVSSGNDGNSTFNTVSQNTNNSGSAGAVVTTSSNPPYHTVHFIIKT